MILEIPDGDTVIDELPHRLADELLTEEAIDANPSFVTIAIELAMKGDDLAAGEVLRAVHRRAGESEFAISEWIRMKEWQEFGGA